jgi:hypothetical protein
VADTHESPEVNWSRLITPRAVRLILEAALEHFQHRECRLRRRRGTAATAVACAKWEHLCR